MANSGWERVYASMLSRGLAVAAFWKSISDDTTTTITVMMEFGIDEYEGEDNIRVRGAFRCLSGAIVGMAMRDTVTISEVVWYVERLNLIDDGVETLVHITR